MENKEYLRHLFTEDIFIVNEQPQKSQSDESADNKIDSHPRLKFKGSVDNNVLIYNFDKSNEFISQGDELFLQNILKAIKLNISETTIINAAKEEADLSTILSQLNQVKTVLIFGANSIALDVEFYQASSKDNINYLKCDPLSSIEKDKEKKKALWSALQELFL